MNNKIVTILQRLRLTTLACLLCLCAGQVLAGTGDNVGPAVSLDEFKALVAGSDDAGLQGFTCPWSDCRGCEQYRKICGGVQRDFSLFQADPIDFVPTDGDPDQVDDPAPDGVVDIGVPPELAADIGKSTDLGQEESGAEGPVQLADHDSLVPIPTLEYYALVLLSLLLLASGLRQRWHQPDDTAKRG